MTGFLKFTEWIYASGGVKAVGGYGGKTSIVCELLERAALRGKKRPYWALFNALERVAPTGWPGWIAETMSH